MKNSNKQIILLFPLVICLSFLYMPKSSRSAQCCETFYCKTNYSRSYGGSVEYPFRVIGEQPRSCGCSGFDLYCDDELGLLLQLPGAGNLTVDYIYHSSRKIQLSDPNDCLPQRLLSGFYLSTTPFRGVTQSTYFLVYKCTGIDIGHLYEEKIDCLSGSDYTVISELRERSSFTRNGDPNCTFLTTVSVPTEYDFSYLSSFSTIDLTWDEHECFPCFSDIFVPDEPPSPPPASINRPEPVGLILGIALPILFFILCIIFFCRRSSGQTPSAQSPPTTSRNTNVNTSAPTSSGLDQITIDSYPIVVLGKHGDLTNKPEHESCAICLAEYSPKDTLKMLPHCLHRFHVDCIDMWLKTQPTCPVCRTSPAQQLLIS